MTDQTIATSIPAVSTQKTFAKAPTGAMLAKGTRWIVDLALVGTIAYLSMPVVAWQKHLEARDGIQRCSNPTLALLYDLISFNSWI